GELLSVDVTIMNGAGKLNLTGQLGNVMKESAQAALSYLRASAKKLGLNPDFFKGKEIHIHLPEGAIPKDGPSAGITLATAIVSVLSERPVRKDIAMTGEITLRGNVLPVGGVKEKVLAARRAKIKQVILPEQNEKDLEDIPKEVLADLQFTFVDNAKQVFREALLPIQKKQKQKVAEKTDT
ncbi:MAG: S16 family serine protease, partial [Pyrinomonadaceae bacterium]